MKLKWIAQPKGVEIAVVSNCIHSEPLKVNSSSNPDKGVMWQAWNDVGYAHTLE